jgi:predicted HAD superfamily Cof-like phosphohydrolase
MEAEMSTPGDYYDRKTAEARRLHLAGDHPIAPKPVIPEEDRLRLRAALIAEECFEFLEAVFDERGFGHLKEEVLEKIADYPLEPLVPAMADALADIDYVVEGTRLELGIDGTPVADEVHRSNMAKFGPGSSKRPDGKTMKPPGWKPPDIEGVLRRQGWEG